MQTRGIPAVYLYSLRCYNIAIKLTGVWKVRIGERVRVIDRNSEFFGLVVIITDKRVEPKPHPYTVYKVVTEDGLPPKNFPFSSISLSAEQVRPVRERRMTDDPKLSRDYLLITTLELEDDQDVLFKVERFSNTTKDEIADYIVKRNIYRLSDSGGTLLHDSNPVKYEVIEVDKQTDCINATVMCLYELEKTELEMLERAAYEILKAKRDRLAENTQLNEKRKKVIKKDMADNKTADLFQGFWKTEDSGEDIDVKM